MKRITSRQQEKKARISKKKGAGTLHTRIIRTVADVLAPLAFEKHVELEPGCALPAADRFAMSLHVPS